MTKTHALPTDEAEDALLVFVSYGGDRGDEHVASEFRSELLPRLRKWGVTAWTDDDLDAREGPYDAIGRALKDAALVLYVLTQRSAEPGHFTARELASAQNAGTQIIVLRVEPDHPDLRLPVLAENTLLIEFGGARRLAGWEKLRVELRRQSTVKGQIGRVETRLQALRSRRAKAPEAADAFDERIAQLERELDQLHQRLMATRPADRQQRDITAGVERERMPGRPNTNNSPIPSVGEPPATAPGQFQDRIAVIEVLERQLAATGVRMVSVTGDQHGIGKTAMIRKMWDRMETGATLKVAGRAYMSAEQFEPISAHLLLDALLRFAGEESVTDALGLLIEPVPWVEKLTRVLDALGGRRVLVILDAVEELLDNQHEIRDPSLREVIDYLVQHPGHGVVLLLAGRKAPQALLEQAGAAAVGSSLVEGLPAEDAWKAFKSAAPQGWRGLEPKPNADIQWLHRLTGGSPRALELAAGALTEDMSLSSLITLLQSLRRRDASADMATLLFARAVERLSTTEKRVAQALATYRRPIPSEAVDFLLQTYVAGIDSGPMLTSMHSARLVRRDGDYYYLPPTAESDLLLGALPMGTIGDSELATSLFTQTALLHRGAEWFASTRVENPGRVGDLRAHLAEIELRIRADEHEKALGLMGEVDDRYLRPWGYSATLVPFIQRLLDSDALDSSLRVEALSLVARALMQNEAYAQAIPHLHSALSMRRLLASRRVTLYRQLTAAHLGNEDLGRAEQASRAALRAAYVVGRPSEVAPALWARADVLTRSGQIRSAALLLRAASPLLHRRGAQSDKETVTMYGVTRAWLYQLLGDQQKAETEFERARINAEDSGLRQEQAKCLIMEGQLLIHLAQPYEAIQKASSAASIALEGGSWRLCREAKEIQALACLSLEDLPAAESASRIACRHRSSVFGWGLRGLVAFRRGDDDAASTAFKRGHAIAQENLRTGGENFLLERNYSLLDSQGLVACGLALLDNESHYLPISLASYRAARSRTRVPGVLADVQLYIDQFGGRADRRILTMVRAAAAGTG